MDSLLLDVRFGVRSLRRRPVFSLVAILTLSLGIGSATAIFSAVEGVLLRPLPFHRPQELVTVSQTIPEWRTHERLSRHWDRIPFSQPAFQRLREGQSSFTDVAIYRLGTATLLGEGEPTTVPVGVVSSSLLSVLHATPILGRSFLPEEDGPAVTRVALVSQEIWQERFGSDPDILGRSVNLSGASYTIVGVLPAVLRLRSFSGSGSAFSRGFWVPLGLDADEFRDDSNWYQAVARLRPHVSGDRAEAEAATLVRGEKSSYRYGARVRSLTEEWTGAYRKPLALLLGAALVLLLVACGNVAALLIGETPGREGEMTTRWALGAGGRRLGQQLLVESLLLGAAGSVLGVVISLFGTRLLLGLAPPIPRLEEVGINRWVLLFSVVAGVITSLGFGIAPVLQTASGRAREALGRGVRVAGRRGAFLHRAVVSGEIALTVLLLVGGGLLAKSLFTLLDVDTGFKREGLIEARVSLPSYLVPDPNQRRLIHQEMVEALRALPGVLRVSGAATVPFAGGLNSNGIGIVGRRSGADEEMTVAERRRVYPGYFRTMGIPLLRGRDLSEADRMGAPPVAVISQSMADRFWPGQNPIGARFVAHDTLTVVGVVGDVRHESLKAAHHPTFYIPDAQQAIQVPMSLVLRTAGAPEPLLPLIRDAVRRVHPRAPIRRLAPAPSLVAESTREERFRAVLFVVFGAVAVLLAGAGVFGVTARGVEARRGEMGIRVALGARACHLLRLTMLPGLSAGLIGLVTGTAAALGASRLLSGFLFEVKTWDPTTYGIVAFTVLGISLAATYLPSRRIQSLDPATVLREE
jgi:putative ABC transport system permease protein